MYTIKKSKVSRKTSKRRSRSRKTSKRRSISRKTSKRRSLRGTKKCSKSFFSYANDPKVEYIIINKNTNPNPKYEEINLITRSNIEKNVLYDLIKENSEFKEELKVIEKLPDTVTNNKQLEALQYLAEKIYLIGLIYRRIKTIITDDILRDMNTNDLHMNLNLQNTRLNDIKRKSISYLQSMLNIDNRSPNDIEIITNLQNMSLTDLQNMTPNELQNILNLKNRLLIDLKQIAIILGINSKYTIKPLVDSRIRSIFQEKLPNTLHNNNGVIDYNNYYILESSYIDAQDKLNAVQDERIRNP